MLIHPAVVDGHAMGAEVVGRLLRQQFIWGGGLALAHGLWLQRRHTISTFDQFPREGRAGRLIAEWPRPEESVFIEIGGAMTDETPPQQIREAA